LRERIAFDLVQRCRRRRADKPSFFASHQQSGGDKTAQQHEQRHRTRPDLAHASGDCCAAQVDQSKRPLKIRLCNSTSSTAWRWQQRAVASALQQLAAAHTVAAPSASSTLRVRRLLELSRSAMETAVALMLAEERDNAFRTALALAVNDSRRRRRRKYDECRVCKMWRDQWRTDLCQVRRRRFFGFRRESAAQQQAHLLRLSLLRSLAERLVDAGNAHAAALGALTERSLVQKDAADALAAAAATNAVSEDTVAAATTSGAATTRRRR
jgi:hypothetical protein